MTDTPLYTLARPFEEIEALRAQLAEAHDLVIDLFAQAAWVDCTADEEYPLSDMALSALEDAAQYLLQHNEIQQHPSGRRRYRLTPKIEVSSGS